VRNAKGGGRAGAGSTFWARKRKGGWGAGGGEEERPVCRAKVQFSSCACYRATPTHSFVLGPAVINNATQRSQPALATGNIGRRWDMTLRGLLKASLESAMKTASKALALPGSGSRISRWAMASLVWYGEVLNKSFSLSLSRHGLPTPVWSSS
jgi:hypothetical protein